MNIRTGRYQNTGVAAAGSGVRFDVGDAVYLPDSEAGIIVWFDETTYVS